MGEYANIRGNIRQTDYFAIAIATSRGCDFSFTTDDRSLRVMTVCTRYVCCFRDIRRFRRTPFRLCKVHAAIDSRVGCRAGRTRKVSERRFHGVTGNREFCLFLTWRSDLY